MMTAEIIEWMIKCMLVMVFVVPIMSASLFFLIAACYLKRLDEEGESCEQG